MLKYKIDNELFNPILNGDEHDMYFGENRECHDCGCQPGTQHLDSCDCERCPKCLGQLISCDCGDIEEVEYKFDKEVFK